MHAAREFTNVFARLVEIERSKYCAGPLAELWIAHSIERAGQGIAQAAVPEKNAGLSGRKPTRAWVGAWPKGFPRMVPPPLVAAGIPSRDGSPSISPRHWGLESLRFRRVQRRVRGRREPSARRSAWWSGRTGALGPQADCRIRKALAEARAFQLAIVQRSFASGSMQRAVRHRAVLLLDLDEDHDEGEERERLDKGEAEQQEEEDSWACAGVAGECFTR